EKYEDTVEESLSIKRNDTYETTATAGYSKENTDEYIYIPPNVIPDEGGLTVNNSATLAVFLSDGLKYLFEYPYGCSEQAAAKLRAITVMERALKLKNLSDKFTVGEIEFDGQKYPVDKAIEIGLARLYENQQGDGGFSYYPRGWSNIYLTLNMLEVFRDVKSAGYTINEGSIKRAIDYVNNKIRYDNNLQNDNNLMISAAYALSAVREYGMPDNIIIDRVKSLENNEKFLNDEISANSLAYLALLLSTEEKTYGKKFKDKVFKTLENHIEIDSRGAFLPVGENYVWEYYETPVKNTALLIKALTVDKRDDKILDRLLRWILNSRKKDGAWGSTNNTITVVDGLTDYLAWQRETESDFTLKINLNDGEKQSFDYNGETILTQNSFYVPIGEMGLNSFNNILFAKENHNNLKNTFYYDMSLKYYLPIDNIAPRDEGFTIKRGFYAIDDENFEHPLKTAKIGDVLNGHIEIIVPKYRNFAALEDFIPAGVELINFNLETSDQSLKEEEPRGFYYDETLLRPDNEEFRDDRLMLFKENLSPNTYHYEYFIRALVPGKFHHLPAIISEMYTPENFGRTNGEYFEVTAE
ncbi:MAG: hypothetical protein V1860_02725, partial [bacterium]